MMTTENGDVSNYRFPSVELLEKRNDGKEKISIEEIAENENRLKQALEQLGIKIARIETIIGAAITRYDVTLLPGYKFSKIKRLEAELALPLGVLRGRIAEIDPFRPAIIIEIPNTNRGTVSMYSLIQSKTFRENKAELPLAIGQTVENAPFILDLTEISHLLIAGATGQGKTVALHAMITSLLYSKHPGELKFVMIDPKRIEFTPYGKIERHFLAKMESEEAIITDPYKAVDTLNILCLEMDNRLELQKEAGVRNIVEYNEKFTSQRLDPRHGHRYLPYIVVMIDNPSSYPDPSNIVKQEEPFVDVHLYTPNDYVGGLMDLCQSKRGVLIDMKYLDDVRVDLHYALPLGEIVYDFFDAIKSRSRGYASYDYEFKEYRESDLVKLDFLLNGDPVDALSMIVFRDNAYAKGRRICEKLRDNIPRTLFEIPVQAAIGGKIIARETVKAMRKDVLAKCYGGDISRKKKLLEKQKEGKKKMRQLGSVSLPSEAFTAVLKLDSTDD